MDTKSTYSQLKAKTVRIERELREYMCKEKNLTKERRMSDYHYFKRTISLMKINEELTKEIDELKRADTNKIELVSAKLGERVKELRCLYGISGLKAGTSFSLDSALQEIVDYIPPAFKYPENTCARISINRFFDIRTDNFKDTNSKHSQEIKVNNVKIGLLEICYLEENPYVAKALFAKETTDLITAIAESIAQLIEREWVEIELKKSWKKVEEVIGQNSIKEKRKLKKSK